MSQELSGDRMGILGLLWSRKEFMKSQCFCQDKGITSCSGLLRTVTIKCSMLKKKKKVPEYINKVYTPCAAAAKHFILKCSSPQLTYVSTKQPNAVLVVEY